MVKSSKIIATLGVAAGLGIALLPLASHAETTGTETVEVNVTPTIALDVYNTQEESTAAAQRTHKATIEMTRNAKDITIEHVINVNGNYNKGYTLTMAAAGADLEGDKTDAVIPSLTADGAITAGTAAWGYRYTATAADSGSLKGNYGSTETFKVIPTGSGDTLGNNEAARDNGFNDNHYVNFGIATATNQVADKYSQTVTYSVAGVTLPSGS